MRLTRNRFVLALFLITASLAFAQDSTPRIGYVYPAGGKQGTTFEVIVGGQRLDGVANARVNGEGVQARVIEHIKPLSPGEAQNLRERLRELQKKRVEARTSTSATRPTWTAADDRMVAEIQRRLATSNRKPAAPAIAETVVVHVTIAANAPPGDRELRVGTSSGLSNPLVFQVGQLNEVFEAESEGGRNETSISVPALANGQIMPGDVDRFRFKAKKGQRLVVAARARELVPYLPDAVPGWFQGVLALYDSRGNELAYADHHRFHPDPVLLCKIPKDDEYVVEVRDALYRGREDFVYRVSIGEIPFITSTFPLGGKAGAETTVELRGWNLPVATLSPVPREAGLYPLWTKTEDLVSNRVAFAVDTLPEALETEPNNSPAEAQSVTLPLIVNGRIDYSSDKDIFKIQGKAGQQIVAEVIARRLMSPLDSLLKVYDAGGKQLAMNDDHEDKGAGLMTHHADSLLSVKLPADGAYFVQLSDAQRKGGPEFAYRLRLSEPRPDFELRVVPSSISVSGGGLVPLTVFALRRDGFAGDIQVNLKNPPPGFSISGGWVPAGQDRIRLTMTAPPGTQREPSNLSMEGRASVGGQEIVRRAVPAEDMMQAFAYRHLVPAKEMKVVVSARGGGRAGAVVGEGPVRIPAGGSAKVVVAVPGLPAQIQCELSEPPEGMTIASSAVVSGKAEIVVAVDAAKVKPGLKGNLIVIAFAAVADAEKGANARKRGNAVGMLPAVPFEVVGQ